MKALVKDMSIFRYLF